MDNSLESVRLANTFVERFAQSGDITHMKLQKLCYYAYGWWLALCPNEPVLIQSRPQVWKLGPVFQPIYSAFSGHRSNPIGPTHLKPVGPFKPTEVILKAEVNESQIVDWIWARYGHYSGMQLSDMTHEQGTPWHNKVVQKQFRVERFLELTDDEIRPYFVDSAKKEGFIN